MCVAFIIIVALWLVVLLEPRRSNQPTNSYDIYNTHTHTHRQSEWERHIYLKWKKKQTKSYGKHQGVCNNVKQTNERLGRKWNVEIKLFPYIKRHMLYVYHTQSYPNSSPKQCRDDDGDRKKRNFSQSRYLFLDSGIPILVRCRCCCKCCYFFFSE